MHILAVSGVPDTFLEKFLSATEYSEQALLALVPVTQASPNT